VSRIVYGTGGVQQAKDAIGKESENFHGVVQECMSRVEQLYRREMGMEYDERVIGGQRDRVL
jgi:hypothetical protein